MIRYKKTRQQWRRYTAYQHYYCDQDEVVSTKGSHTKHGAWLHAKPLQQLKRWLVPMGHSIRKIHLEGKPRSFTLTSTFLPAGKVL